MSLNAPMEDSCGWGAARARVKRKEERVMRNFMAVGSRSSCKRRNNSFVYGMSVLCGGLEDSIYWDTGINGLNLMFRVEFQDSHGNSAMCRDKLSRGIFQDGLFRSRPEIPAW